MNVDMTTILLAEDERDLAQVIARELEANGYLVVRARDGQAALDLYQADRPDLIILDWMLPKVDGLEVLRQVRQTSPTPVLMLTARGEEVDRVIGLELGADDYLSKPFGMRELIARIRALLRRAELLRSTLAADRSPDQPPMSYGPLALDPGSHRATLEGRELDLTRIEFGLLALLLRNPGRAFSRSYLLDTVWGDEYVGGDRSVDNTVFRLRKKLGCLADAIETVWGIGYRLRPTLPESGQAEQAEQAANLERES